MQLRATACVVQAYVGNRVEELEECEGDEVQVETIRLRSGIENNCSKIIRKVITYGNIALKYEIACYGHRLI